MRWLIPERAATVAFVGAVAACLTGCDGPATGASAGGPRAGEAWFVEEAVPRGLRFVHDSGQQGDRHLLPEAVAGGGALFDMDDDGDLDAYLVQSGDVIDAAARTPNVLFENVGEGRFRPVETGAPDTGFGMGVACGDVDQDGDVDLYVTNYGRNALWLNDGGGRFRDGTDAAGVGHAGLGASAAFLDYDRDGDLDLYVTNYVNWTPESDQFACENKLGGKDYCGPMTYSSPARDVLYRNEGNGRFTDVTRQSGIAARFGNGLGVVAADYTGDGWLDVFVANDMNADLLWVNRDGAAFEDEALLAGCAVDLEGGRPKAGMGVTTGDIDADGDLDLMVCNLVESSDSVFRNDGGFFTDVTSAKGLGTVSRNFTRFGMGWVDLDNDGRLDLYQGNGRILRTNPAHGEDLFAEPNLLFRAGENGRFTEVLPRGGTERPLIGTTRGVAFGDVDNDGGVDVLAINRDGPAHLLMNRATGRRTWIGLDVRESGGRPAEGARVVVRAGETEHRRDVRSAYSYLTCNDPRVHVGLQNADGVDSIEVHWVDGTRERFGALPAGTYHRLQRGQGAP